MIKEAYCSFEVAKLLKEKGFDELCKYLYKDNGERYTLASTCYQNVCDEGECLCPTHQMAMAWLREVYNVFIEIGTSIDLNGNYHFSYTILDNECKYIRRGYTDFDWNYEEACEAVIKYCLENLI